MPVYIYRLNTKIRLTMLCLSGFELYSCWVTRFFWSEIGSGTEEPGGTPLPWIPRSSYPRVIQIATKRKNVTYEPFLSWIIGRKRRLACEMMYTKWNLLPAELRTSHISLALFKRSLFQDYYKALDPYDDIDNIRTWRTIGPGCNIARTLLCQEAHASSNLNFCFVSFWFFLLIYQ